MRLRGYRGGEHICPISCISRIRLDEERHEGVSVTTGGQPLVVPHEETARKGSREHVEGTSEVRLVAESSPSIRRTGKPVVSRQCCGLRGEVAEVVVGDANGPTCIDVDRRREGWPPMRRVDADRSAPVVASVGGGGQSDLIEVAAVEASVLPDDVELPSLGIDRGLRNDVTRSDRLAGVGVGHKDRAKFGDDLRLCPGAAPVSRFHKGNIERLASGVQDQIEEVIERPVARVDHDLVTDRLGILLGVDDDLGSAPSPATVGGLREIRVSSEGTRVRVVVGAIGWRDQSVPNCIRGPSFDRIGGYRLLVGEELAAVARIADDCLQVVPGLAAVSGCRRSDSVLIVAAVKGDGDCVGSAIRSERDPGIRRPLVIEPPCTLAERQRDLGPSAPTIHGDASNQAVRTTVRPAVLLPDTDNVRSIGRVDGDVGLNLSIHIIGTGAADRTGSIEAWAGDSNKWRDGRAGTNQAATYSGHDCQDDQKYREGCYHPDMLQVTHEILLISELCPEMNVNACQFINKKHIDSCPHCGENG